MTFSINENLKQRLKKYATDANLKSFHSYKGEFIQLIIDNGYYYKKDYMELLRILKSIILSNDEFENRKSALDDLIILIDNNYSNSVKS